MSAYPAVPYKPEVGSWSVSPAVPPVQSAMNGGNVRRRNLPGSNVKIITQKVSMTHAEWATLSTFVYTTINNAAARFTMDVWLGDTDPDSTYVNKTVQFMDDTPKISWTSRENVWIDMKLMVFGA